MNSQNFGLKIELFPTHLNSWTLVPFGSHAGGEVPRWDPHLAPSWYQQGSPTVCHSSWWTCLDQPAAYQAMQITPEHGSDCVSGTSKYIISLKISSFQLAEQGNAKTTRAMCVCVSTAASSKGEAAILPGIGWEGRPTWLQAAFNYPESHFNEVLPNALNHSIFRGYLLLYLSLVVNKHLPPAPGHLLGSPSGWWPWRQLIAVGWALHVERHKGGAEGSLLSLLCFRSKAVCRDAIPLGFPAQTWLKDLQCWICAAGYKSCCSAFLAGWRVFWEPLTFGSLLAKGQGTVWVGEDSCSLYANTEVAEGGDTFLRGGSEKAKAHLEHMWRWAGNCSIVGSGGPLTHPLWRWHCHGKSGN